MEYANGMQMKHEREETRLSALAYFLEKLNKNKHDSILNNLNNKVQTLR